MGFPLIQQPAPLQQLAEVLGRWRQATIEQRMQQEDQARRQAYLELNQQEAVDRRAYQEAQLAAGLRGERRQDRAFDYGVEQDKIQLGATAQRDADARGRAHQDYVNNLISQGRASVPDNVTLGVQSALAAGKGGDISGTVAAARANATSGRQGSVVRDARIGQSGDVYFDPGTVNVNLPSGGGSGGRGMNAVDERHAIGAALLEQIIGGADQLEATDAQSSEIPFTTDLGAAAAERVLGHGAGRRVAERIRTSGTTPNQQNYQRYREQFKHSMAVFYPRAAIALMENLADSYFSVPGESATTRANKRQDRAELLRIIQGVREGRVGREALDMHISGRLPADAQLPFAAQDGVNPLAPTPSAEPSDDDFLNALRSRRRP